VLECFSSHLGGGGVITSTVAAVAETVVVVAAVLVLVVVLVVVVVVEVVVVGHDQRDVHTPVEKKRPLCQLSSEREEDNWHSGLLFSTKQRTIWGSIPGRPRVVNSAAIG